MNRDTDKLVSVWLALSSTAMAQRHMTIEDVAAMQYVSSAAISPDGQYIAYTKVVQRNPKKDENGVAWSDFATRVQCCVRPSLSSISIKVRWQHWERLSRFELFRAVPYTIRLIY